MVSKGDKKCATKTKRKTRFHYTDDHDVKLLREILGDNGLFTNGVGKQQWKNIAHTFIADGHDVTAHSLQARLKHIYDAFLTSENVSKKASGVEEEIDEKTTLLTEYHEMWTDKVNVKIEKKTKAQLKDDEDVAGAKALRDAALDSIKPAKAHDDSRDVTKFSIQAYLQATQRMKERDAADAAVAKKRKLDLKERQMALQEKTLQLQQQTIAMFGAILAKAQADV